MEGRNGDEVDVVVNFVIELNFFFEEGNVDFGVEKELSVVIEDFGEVGFDV